MVYTDPPWKSEILIECGFAQKISGYLLVMTIEVQLPEKFRRYRVL